MSTDSPTPPTDADRLAAAIESAIANVAEDYEIPTSAVLIFLQIVCGIERST